MTPLSRRRFVRDLVVCGGALLISGAPAAAAADAWVTVGPIGKFKKGTVTPVDLDRGGGADPATVFITRADDETVSALSARCTHRGCLVDWKGHDHQFACPCHGGRFDASGNASTGSVPYKPLPHLDTRVEGNQVFVFVPAPATNNALSPMPPGQPTDPPNDGGYQH